MALERCGADTSSTLCANRRFSPSISLYVWFQLLRVSFVQSCRFIVACAPDQSPFRAHFFNDSTTGHCVLAGPVSVFFSAAQVYEHGKSAFASLLCDRLKVCDSPAAAIPLSGGLSGACAWFVSFPLDCVKSGLQGRPFTVAVSRAAELAARGAATDSAGATSAAANSAVHTVTGTSGTASTGTASRVLTGQQTNAMSVGGGDGGGAFRVARHLFATRGIGGFYAGIVPSIARAFIVSGTRFSAYEATMWALKK
jgi:hypothetical protein